VFLDGHPVERGQARADPNEAQIAIPQPKPELRVLEQAVQYGRGIDGELSSRALQRSNLPVAFRRVQHG
jgi:hypothetical protein